MADAAGLHGAEAGADATGLYIEGRKLGSVGIRVSGGITMHGLALNRDPELRWFAAMTACGAPDVVTTSIVAEGGDGDRERVGSALAESAAARLGLELDPAAAGCPGICERSTPDGPGATEVARFGSTRAS
jgi:lipoyl(octanoyl) transferase